MEWIKKLRFSRKSLQLKKIIFGQDYKTWKKENGYLKKNKNSIKCCCYRLWN